jgi:hypothetical protein
MQREGKDMAGLPGRSGGARRGTGGARAGAGRKRRSEKYSEAIAPAEQKIVDRLLWLVTQEMALAEGVLAESSTPDRPVYRIPPDRQAIEYLMNRIMGKPAERQEHDVDAEIAAIIEELASFHK